MTRHEKLPEVRNGVCLASANAMLFAALRLFSFHFSTKCVVSAGTYTTGAHDSAVEKGAGYRRACRIKDLCSLVSQPIKPSILKTQRILHLSGMMQRLG